MQEALPTATSDQVAAVLAAVAPDEVVRSMELVRQDNYEHISKAIDRVLGLPRPPLLEFARSIVDMPAGRHTGGYAGTVALHMKAAKLTRKGKKLVRAMSAFNASVETTRSIHGSPSNRDIRELGKAAIQVFTELTRRRTLSTRAQPSAQQPTVTAPPAPPAPPSSQTPSVPPVSGAVGVANTAASDSVAPTAPAPAPGPAPAPPAPWVPPVGLSLLQRVSRDRSLAKHEARARGVVDEVVGADADPQLVPLVQKWAAQLARTQTVNPRALLELGARIVLRAGGQVAKSLKTGLPHVCMLAELACTPVDNVVEPAEVVEHLSKACSTVCEKWQTGIVSQHLDDVTRYGAYVGAVVRVWLCFC